MSQSQPQFHIKVIGWLCIAAFLYLMIEASAWVVLKAGLIEDKASAQLESLASSMSQSQKEKILNALGDEANLPIDDTLGWVSPMRSPGAFEHKKSVNTQRILTLGDSFTFGAEVETEESWPFLLDKALPQAEVMNFGVPAYGLDQAYLRYLEEAEAYEHDIVVIGFIIEDADRNVSGFRPFKLRSTNVPYTKPRFVLRDNTLELIPNFLQKEDYEKMLSAECVKMDKEGQQDCPFSMVNTSMLSHLPSMQLFANLHIEDNGVDVPREQKEQVTELTSQIFLEFYRRVEKNGAEPVILLMPRKADVHQANTFTAYEEFFQVNKLRYLNVTPALQKEELNSLFRGGGHYSPLGNQLVATAIEAYLEKEELLSD